MSRKLTITCISDTHARHSALDKDMPGGDILLCSGDFMMSGYKSLEVDFFCSWLAKQNYKHKIFIAGNHDRLFQLKPEKMEKLVSKYNVTYLQDSSVIVEGFKIYGSPWQPWFHDWAFNLPRNGDELKSKWDAIPTDTDILLTHGPPHGILDTSGPPWNQSGIGCELLAERLKDLNISMHVFGHVHGSYGKILSKQTQYINASSLNERYIYTNKPIQVSIDRKV